MQCEWAEYDHGKRVGCFSEATEPIEIKERIIPNVGAPMILHVCPEHAASLTKIFGSDRHHWTVCRRVEEGVKA